MFIKVLVAFAIIGIAAGRVYIPLSRRERFREVLEEECEKYGGEDHLDEVEQAAYQFIDCFFENVDMMSLQSLAQESDMSAQRKGLLEIIRSTCTKKTQLTTCTFSFMNASLPCVDPKIQSQIDIAKKSVEEYASYICDNNAAEVSRLLDDGVYQCLNDKAYGLQFCVNRVQRFGNYRTLDNTQACNAFEELKTCTVDTLKECPKKTTADFFEYTLDAIKKGSRCDNSNTITVNSI